MQQHQQPKILRLPAVLEATGLRRSTVFARIANGTFPKQIKLGRGARAVGWVEGEVYDWIRSHIAASRGSHP